MLRVMQESFFVKAAVAASICGVLALAPARSLANDTEQAGVDAGLGIGTVAANLLYVPAKLCYAVLGTLTGGAAYVVTGFNQTTAEDIIVPALGGDYVLSPEQVAGRKAFHFSGLREVEAAGAEAEPADPTDYEADAGF